jgi:hypothetical protein
MTDLTFTANADTSQLEDQFARAAQAMQASIDQLRQTIERTNEAFGKLADSSKHKMGEAAKATDTWGKAFASVQTAFEKSISGMILGTTTWQKTVQNLAQLAAKQMIDAAIKSSIDWAIQEGVKTGATEAGVAQRTAAEADGQSAGLAQMVMSALKAIATNAATAASGAYSSASQIPYVGWILGPIAAAAAFAAVMAFGGHIPSAAGGLWNVPSDTLAMVHKQETIIPAAIAQPMRDFFTGDGGSGGGSSYAITIQAIDTQSGAQFLMNNAPLIAKSLAREMRNGNSVFRSAS